MVGIDIEKVDRFKDFNKTKLSRIFTKQEIEYCFSFSNPLPHIAGIWCAKEAFVKAMKNKQIPLKDIEIMHDKTGAPFVHISKKLEQFFCENNASFVDVSISHTETDAVAVVQIF